MGQARDRGTYEERKALAIKEQDNRTREEKPGSKVVLAGSSLPFVVALAMANGSIMRYRKPSWL